VSPSKTIVGAIEEKRFLPGAIEPARPGRGSYQFIAPFSMKPVPGGMTPLGVPSVWVSDATSPSASTQEIVVVSRGSPSTRARAVRSPRRIRSAQASA